MRSAESVRYSLNKIEEMDSRWALEIRTLSRVIFLRVVIYFNRLAVFLCKIRIDGDGCLFRIYFSIFSLALRHSATYVDGVFLRRFISVF